MNNISNKIDDLDKELKDLDSMLNSDGDTVVDINHLEEFLEKFSKEENSYDRELVEERFIELLLDIESYYTRSQSNSDLVRNKFSTFPNVIRYLESFPSLISEKIQNAKDYDLATAGLLAASIQNLSLDPRDSLLSLDEFISKLIEKKINFSKKLRLIAEVSSDEKRGNFGSAKSNLLKYLNDTK